ncbi:arabinose-proton symporter [Acetobacter orientalis]|uniref:Arabinose-proton symporter n=1 Tax=Acetobacter orientalis TaxID=146474 RepID=A0A2Z5ZLK7_9PROT|nr:arabinose-proton symporter [Acetobacter orientalis]
MAVAHTYSNALYRLHLPCGLGCQGSIQPAIYADHTPIAMRKTHKPF